MNNPFDTGGAVPPQRFVGRSWLINALAQRCKQGNSIILVGKTTTGRTSILQRLEHELLSPTYADATVPSFFDIQTLAADASPADFWELALAPFVMQPWCEQLPRDVLESFERARAQGFRSIFLKNLIKTLSVHGRRLVLLIDHIDKILLKPGIRTSAFLGGLRARTSDGRYPLAMVPTSAISSIELHRQLQRHDPGSPCFNNLIEYVLGPASASEIGELLDRAGALFDERDRAFILEASGGLLYYAQVLAGCLWEFRSQSVARHDARLAAGINARQLVQTTLELHWWERSIGDRSILTSIALSQLGVNRREALRGPSSDRCARPPPPGRRHAAICALLVDCLSPFRLRELVRRLPSPNLVAHLPAEVAPHAETCAAVAELVMRGNLIEPLLRELAREFPRHYVRIREVADLWHVRDLGISVGHGLIMAPNYDELRRSGVLASRGSAMVISPAIEFWWLIEQMRSLARADISPEGWFIERGLAELDPRLKQSLAHAIDEVRDRLLGGAEPFIREAAQ